MGAGALGEVVQGVKRIGDRIAVQDPAQVTALRQTLMQAGFASREAVTIYLGAKAAAMAVAIAARPVRRSGKRHLPSSWRFPSGRIVRRLKDGT